MADQQNEGPQGSEARSDALAREVRHLRRALRARELLLEERERQLAEKSELVRAMLESRSWRLTRPLRAGTRILKKLVTAGKPDPTQRVLEAMFDPDWYSRSYGRVGERLLDDYLTRGWREGRDPSPLFDGSWYVAEFDGRPSSMSPLEDFASHPYDRRPNRWFDPAIWRRAMNRPGPDVATYLGGLKVAEGWGTPDGEVGARLSVRSGAQQLEDGCAACVFVHHDVQSRFDAHVASTLSALARAGRRVVVCSTSIVDVAQCKPLLANVASIVSVPNHGYDWGAYHAGLGFVLDRCSPASVELMNDSVYVIAADLDAFLERVEQSRGDVVGATDSLMFSYHLQSYFVHLGRAALESALIREFLETFVPVSEKHYVINSYEIGFSRRAIHHGLALDAVYPFENLAAPPRSMSGWEVAPNPTLELWEGLRRLGSPFVKVQLLRDLAPDPKRVRELVPTDTLRVAAAHLERIGGRDVPGWAR